MLKSVLAAMLLAAIAAPAGATALVLDHGWEYDLVISQPVASEGSPYTFTLAGSGILRLTDTNLPGDIFTASDAAAGITTTTSFTTDGAAVPDLEGVSWTNLNFSRFSLLLGPGSYSFEIRTDCIIRCPAGFGIRLDSAPGVPEPASWALLMAGFGLTGAMLRRRQALHLRGVSA